MTGMTTDKRQPKGIPTGGEFAAHDRADADVSLTGADTPRRMGALNSLTVPGPYSISAYKSAGMGREGYMWSAKLLRDGKHVADLTQEGSGGQLFVRYTDRAEEQLAAEYVAKWTHKWGSEYGSELDYDEDAVFSEMAEAKRITPSLNRAAKKGLVFMATADGSPEKGYYATNVPSTAEGRAEVKSKYPEAVFWDGENWTAGE